MAKKTGCAIAAALAMTASLGADDLATARAGASVRVTFNEGSIPNGPAQPWKGKLLAIDGSSLKLELSGRTDALEAPLDSVSRLEVRRPKKTVKGVLLGMATGLTAGIVLGSLSSGCQGYHYEGCTAPAALGLLGAAGGAVVGGMLGSRERWDEVRLNQPRLSLLPSRHGLAVRVSFAFDPREPRKGADDNRERSASGR